MEIVKAVQGNLVHGNPRVCFAAFNSDSRGVHPGDLFWALKGERFDGHDFVSQAIRQGASGVVVQKGYTISVEDRPEIAVIAVDNTLRALGDLAAWWRRQHTVKLAAITGSSGKTTAKEMTATILEMGNKTLKNPGNHNNLIGLPVTLLKLDESHKRAVIEMGMNHKGEIARLTQIADPDTAAILNVGMAHLEGLGDIDGVAEAKTELIAQSSPDAKIILNGDDAVLMRHASQFDREFVTFGMKKGNDIRAVHIETVALNGIRFDLSCGDDTWPIQLPTSGIHNVKNALAAAAIALCLNEPAENIVKGLRTFKGVKGRFQCIPLEGDVLLIDDTYNANPFALEATLLSALKMVNKDGRLIVGLGDMLELGEAAVSAHQEAGSRIAKSGASWLFFMGTHGENVKKGAISAGMPSNQVIISETHDELTTNIIQKTRSNDVIFLKGSRKMQFEKVSDGLEMHFKRSFAKE
ncbi:MAG: UDP-N-acetylmuramoyl-tripeptide--D-alanyl-D-alanine ligase [Deltaproteobacteria bacterium]|nr:UDP-N-acetylmuramoyl-tripeptide--D-alanyl-D-alanine ligase [Deltaproteobacteria bacterium]